MLFLSEKLNDPRIPGKTFSTRMKTPICRLTGTPMWRSAFFSKVVFVPE